MKEDIIQLTEDIKERMEDLSKEESTPVTKAKINELLMTTIRLNDILIKELTKKK